MQLVDSDWPANILAGSHFQAQETRVLSPDGVCALARAWLGTRLVSGVIQNMAIMQLLVVPSQLLVTQERAPVNL